MENKFGIQARGNEAARSRIESAKRLFRLLTIGDDDEWRAGWLFSDMIDPLWMDRAGKRLPPKIEYEHVTGSRLGRLDTIHG